MSDRIVVNVTDPLWGAVLGEMTLITHSREKCEGRGIPCCVHSPSDHHMVGWSMTWRADKGVMERKCVHDVGHPDPDHLAYVRSLTPEHECVFNRGQSVSFSEWVELDEQDACIFPHLEWQSIHGCCPELCCVPPAEREGS